MVKEVVTPEQRLGTVINELLERYEFYANVALLVKRFVVNPLRSYGDEVYAETRHIDMPTLIVSEKLLFTRMDTAIGVIVHELLHIIMKHIPRTQKIVLSISHETELPPNIVMQLIQKIANIAADISINHFISEFRESTMKRFLTVPKVETIFGIKLPAKATFEEYFWRIYDEFMRTHMNNMGKELSEFMGKMLAKSNSQSGTGQQQNQGGQQGQQQGQGQGQGSGDKTNKSGQQSPGGINRQQEEEIENKVSEIMKKHLGKDFEKITEALKNTMSRMVTDTKEEISEAKAQQMDNQYNAFIREAYMSTSEKGRGNIPGEVAELINFVINPPKIRFEKFMKDTIESEIKLYRELTFRKYDRRFGTIPGQRNSYKSKITLVIDTSGSMDSEELALALGVMNRIARQFDMVVVEIDTRVTDVRKVSRIQKEYEFKGRGGTEFSDFFRLLDPRHKPESKIRRKWKSLLKGTALVVFVTDTDGWIEGDYTQKSFKTPILWVTTVPPEHISNEVKEFGGKLIFFRNEDEYELVNL